MFHGLAMEALKQTFGAFAFLRTYCSTEDESVMTTHLYSIDC